MAKYYKSKADKAMTQLSEVYGQFVAERDRLNERTIASYQGGTQREVVQEIAPLIAGAARAAAPVIAKGAAALAQGAASALGGKVVNAVTGNEDQESIGQGGPAQDFAVGDLVEVDGDSDGWSGEIVGVVAERPDHWWVHDDADLEEVAKQVHRDYITLSKTIADETRPEDTPGQWTAGRTGL